MQEKKLSVQLSSSKKFLLQFEHEKQNDASELAKLSFENFKVAPDQLCLNAEGRVFRPKGGTTEPQLDWDIYGRLRLKDRSAGNGPGNIMRVYQIPYEYLNGDPEQPVVILPMKAKKSPYGMQKIYGAGFPALPGGTADFNDVIECIRDNRSLFPIVLRREIREEMPYYQQDQSKPIERLREVTVGNNAMTFFLGPVQEKSSTSSQLTEREQSAPAYNEMSGQILKINVADFSRKIATMETQPSTERLVIMIAEEAREQGLIESPLPTNREGWLCKEKATSPERDFFTSSSMWEVAAYIWRWHKNHTKNA